MVSMRAWPGLRSEKESFAWGSSLKVWPGWMAPLGLEARMTVWVVAMLGDGRGVGRWVVGEDQQL